MSCQLTNKKSPRLIKENFIQKIAIIRKIQSERNQNLTYSEIIYLLDYPRLKFNFIKICLAQIYGQQYQSTNKEWKNSVKDTKILTDFLVISRKMIEEPWIEAQVNKKNQQEKEMQFERYEYKQKTKEETKQKIKQLKGELKIVEGQIDITKNENQNLNLRQKYSKMQQQYNFWRNKSWKLNHLQQIKTANKQGNINSAKFDALSKLIEEQMKEVKRAKFVQSLGYGNNSPQHSSHQGSAENKDNSKLNILQRIFEDYAKKQIKETMFFDEMMNTFKNISLQNFLRLIHDSGIAILLTLEERVKIFKQNSQFDKKVNFVVFTNILQEICRKQCEKLNVKYNSKVLNTYVQQLIAKIKDKERSKYLNASIPNTSPETSQVNNLRSKIISSYHYKLRSHTGKYKEDIEQNLKRRKQQKKEAQHNRQVSKNSHPTLNSIEIVKAKQKQPSIKMKTDFAESFVYRNSSVKKSQESITKYDDQSNKKKMQYMSSEGNSYSKVFYKKMETYNKNRKFKTQFQKIKQQKEEFMTPKEKSSPNNVKQNPVYRTNDFSSEAIANPVDQSNKELSKILKLDEDDFFLTTHLKSVELRAKDIEKLINRGQRQIHY